MSNDKIVRLVEHRGGVSVDDTDDLMDWGVNWLERLRKESREGHIPLPTRLLLVVQTSDYEVITLGQGLGPMSGTEVIGMLTRAATLRAMGGGTIDALYEEDNPDE